VEHLNNMNTDVLWKILGNPAGAKTANAPDIQSLVDEYPQSGLFRALLAANGNEQHIRHAAIYLNPATLYKLIHAPESLQEVTADQIIQTDASLPADEISQPFPFMSSGIVVEPDFSFTPPWAEDYKAIEEAESIGENTDADNKAIEYYPAGEKEDVMQDLAAVEVEPVAGIKQEAYFHQEELKEEVSAIGNKEPEPTYPFTEKTEYFHQDISDEIHDIDDEVYDEIVSIEDINLEQLAAFNKQSEYAAPVIYHTDKITDSNHFVLEPETAVGSGRPEENHGVSDTPGIIVAANEIQVNRNRDISRYNDEKLPYTFMWWLDKTRKQHATTYQPYVSNPSLNTNNGFKSIKRDTMDELQQQYVESIFNVSVIDELERSANLNNGTTERKEDKIIKRFIQSEPHIKHAGGVNLDNENKAKRSSEDANEMITETLARIYTEQMLYQKAIKAYKKLMLKFPEKSLYFASQIEQLENRT
jgi:hypothetical protein